MAGTVTIVTVATGDDYVRFAQQLRESANENWLAGRKPGKPVKFVQLEGPSGWPDATMYRWHLLLDAIRQIETRFVFLLDADMLIEGKVGDEVLPLEDGDWGITAVQHPGYVGRPRAELPYETRQESVCFVPPEEGGSYFCGGVVGGGRLGVRALAEQITLLIDLDRQRGITPVWHDESALNRALARRPPEVVLPPSHCYPDNDAAYRSWWPLQWRRAIVALDKTQAERGDR